MDPKSARISITGSFGFRDIGDEAMLTADVAFLREELGVGEERIELFGDDPDYVARYHRHPRHRCHPSAQLVSEWQLAQVVPTTATARAKAFLRRRLPRLRGSRSERAARTAVRRSDVALVTGGGTINTREESGWSLRRVHAVVCYFRSLGLRVFMSGQTIGPLGLMPAHDELAREIINAVDVLTVRDDGYSRYYLDRIGARPKQFLETFDDAFDLPPDEGPWPAELEDFFAAEPVVAVNVTDYTADSDAKRGFMAALITRIVYEGGSSVLLVGHTPKDLDHLDDVRQRLSATIRSRVLLPDTREWSASQSKAAIARCTVAVGGRYHFIVFAGTSSVPFVGMCGNEYSYVKQHGFARALGLGDWILRERDTWDADIVWATFRRAWRERPVARVRSGASASMKLFAEWLRSL